MAKQAVRILITDAGGPDQPMILHLLHRGTLADADALQDLKIVLVQSPHPLVEGIIEATDAGEACNGVEFAMLIGMVPKKTSRESLVNNYRNYKLQADALENYAAANCKEYPFGYREMKVADDTLHEQAAEINMLRKNIANKMARDYNMPKIP